LDWDIIFKMNWLSTCGTKTDCKDEKSEEVYFYGPKREKFYSLIFAMTASKLWCKRCIDILTSCHWHSEKEEKVEDIFVVVNLGMIFSKNYQDYALNENWLLDHLASEAQLIFKASYSYCPNWVYKIKDSVRWAVTKEMYLTKCFAMRVTSFYLWKGRRMEPLGQVLITSSWTRSK